MHKFYWNNAGSSRSVHSGEGADRPAYAYAGVRGYIPHDQPHYQGRDPYRPSGGHADYTDRLSVHSGDRLSVHSADRPSAALVGGPIGYPTERYSTYSECAMDRTVMDERVIANATDCCSGTVVRVSVTSGGGGGDGVPVERGPPAGSHRVLLKLRRMSGGSSIQAGRPKSVPDLSNLMSRPADQGCDNSGTSHVPSLTAGELRRLNISEGEYESLEAMESAKFAEQCSRPGQAPARVRQSKSLHFYEHKNKTWNQNTLRHVDYDGRPPATRPSVMEYYQHHNYENVYGESEDPYGALQPKHNTLREAIISLNIL